MLRKINLAHSSGSQQADDAEPSERRTVRQRHGRIVPRSAATRRRSFGLTPRSFHHRAIRSCPQMSESAKVVAANQHMDRHKGGELMQAYRLWTQGRSWCDYEMTIQDKYL